MAGATAPTAELLAFDTVDSYSMGGDSEVWYRLEPSVTGSYRFKVDGVTGSDQPYCDVYRVTAPITDPYPYTDPWIGWIGDNPAAQSQEACIELLAGEVYLVACYTWSGGTSGDFTIEVESGVGPANDRIVNAVVLVDAENILTGTTVGASEEEAGGEFNSGNQAGSVWYKAVMGGPGDFRYKIESLTPGWIPSIEIYYPTGGPVSDFGDLTYDSSQDAGDGTETPPTRYYDQILPGGDLAPIEGGETFYLRVISYNQDNAKDKGAFKITVFVTPETVCLDAADYLGSSSTASIVSGAVRETQDIDYSWGATPVRPWEGWMGDLEDTLSIPGADIASSPGFYSVTIKTKNASGFWLVGLLRNDQPLWPGAELDSSATSTPYQDYVTMPAGSEHPNTLDMTRYLPVKPGDTIKVVAAVSGTGTIDIDQICFQRVLNAVEDPAYDILDIPDYPLGTTSGDMNTNAQQGDLIVGKDTAPTFTTHAVTCFDMCVTDDGTLWVTHMQRNGTSGATVTGPVLQYWNGTSWTVVSDDIEGLGVKRAAPSGSLAGPQTLSMDTDGEDIWIVYHVDDGPVAYGTGRKVKLKVKKYDVSAASWSTVGGLITGTNVYVGGSADAPWEHTKGFEQYGSTPTIRVSPAGVPWVGFVEYEAAVGYENYLPYYAIFAYVARWTGSAWDVDRLPTRSEFTEPSVTVFQAKDYRVASGTTSEETYLGETAVKETQTTYANDTCSFTPPAGKWLFQPRLAKNYISGVACGLEFKWYKNGVQLTPYTSDGDSGDNTNDFKWTRWGTGTYTDLYTECDGSTDVISIRLKKTGAGTQDIYIDELICIPAEVYIQQDGFGINAAFTDDGQPHVALFMHRVGENGLGENPGALYQTTFTVPNIDNPAGADYWAPDNAGDDCWNWQTWIYSEWNGSQWVRKWQKLIEEDAPEHVYLQTYTDGIASTPPVGHFQQGFGFATDGIDNYMVACCGGGQAFGFFPDQIIALKITDTGFLPFTAGPPGGLTSFGYPQWDDGDGGVGQYSWAWDATGRSIHVDINGNVWVGFNSVGGAPAEYTNVITHAVKNGLGDWFVAALNNEEFGYDNTYASTPAICSSPDGTKVYILWDTFIYDDGTAPNNPYTFGVWECDVIEGAKIPLIPIFGGPIDLARLKFRSYYIGDV